MEAFFRNVYEESVMAVVRTVGAVSLAAVWVAACGAVDAVKELKNDVLRSTDLAQEILAKRRNHCTEEGGRIAEELSATPCTDGKMTLTFDGESVEQKCSSGDGTNLEVQCVHSDEHGVYFNDGPSTPDFAQSISRLLGDELSNWRWNDIFWDSCINHDYCYHHNDATYGYTKEDCDKQMLEDLATLCLQQSGSEQIGCRTNAAIMYVAVTVGAADAWSAMNSHVEYPEWVLLWKTYGMEGPPSDAALADRVLDFKKKWDATF